ncbi:MAG: response regulator transcription factor [Anaerolineae bacterium]|nr:response regulator transcription factor [Candidatus Roseilinea sp.]MDW8448393.1 response regulator transcription factor [Anaerolineae bacterium]
MSDHDISILLVEDQTLMRQGLRTILNLEAGLRVVGEASDGEAGVGEALRLRPDVILMDVQMPKMNGVDATRAIVSTWPEAKVIVLTTFNFDDYVFQSVRAGAMGYLLKDAPAETLIQTIRRVHAGEVFIQPEVASRALRELAAGGPRAEPQSFDLSEREREVLVLLAQGLSNREIAARLFITEGTVKNHVSNILAKLQAENRTQAAEIARRRGLTPP